jgi:hypothetical protein
VPAEKERRISLLREGTPLLDIKAGVLFKKVYLLLSLNMNTNLISRSVSCMVWGTLGYYLNFNVGYTFITSSRMDSTLEKKRP